MINYIGYLFLNFISLFFVLLVVLVGVAFLTLLERKVLGYIQIRKGPNKVGVLGIFQPFRDAIKLFNKEVFIIFKSSYYLFYISPILLFFLMLINWLLIPIITNIYYINYSVLLMIIILTLIGYIFLFMRWSSNSIYSMIGSMRVIAQTLSYEVRLIIIILVIIVLGERYSFVDFMWWQVYMWFMFIVFPLFIVFYISILAELNRTPMDFVEGESELVSGFNVEYFRGGFAIIFMSEYGIIIFFSYVLLLLFTNLGGSLLFIFIILNFIILLIVFMRGMLPRIRYDELIYLCWKIILPFILMYIVYILSFKFIFILVI